MSFSEQSSSFFDELTAIVDNQVKQREAELSESGRPFSSSLTQDDEPNPDYNPQQAEEQEPEVITRGES